MKTLTSHLSVLPPTAPVRIEPSGEGIRVSVPANERVTLIERFQSNDAQLYSTQSRVSVSVAPGARVNHYKLVLEGPHADHQSFLEAHVERGAAFYSHVFLMAGAHIRNTLQVRLTGENAECVLNGLYVGGGKQVIETNTLIEHQKPHGSSREFYKGILDGEAQGSFDGLIVVAKDAQKTDSSQVNKNLLLSPKAKARSLPELKILANDVKCKHGSTIGQLDPQQLFYLRSRGIPQQEARQVLIYAFASEMIELVEVDEVRAFLLPCLNLTTSTKK
jgi:Fe-S cluster assembly protein SufD